MYVYHSARKKVMYKSFVSLKRQVQMCTLSSWWKKPMCYYKKCCCCAINETSCRSQDDVIPFAALSANGSRCLPPPADYCYRCLSVSMSVTHLNSMPLPNYFELFHVFVYCGRHQHFFPLFHSISWQQSASFAAAAKMTSFPLQLLLSVSHQHRPKHKPNL